MIEFEKDLLKFKVFGTREEMGKYAAEKTGHENHFSMVPANFREYLEGKDIPDLEKINTLTKYDLTARSVSMALIK